MRTANCPKRDLKMRKEGKLDEMGSGRILPLIFKYAWPAIVTMTINQLYNVVDRMYIGQGCGRDAIAGLALTFPFMGALAAVGVLIGLGSSTVISIFLGAGKREDAERALGQCVALKVLFGLVVPPMVYFFLLNPIIDLMTGDGATAETVRLAKLYLSTTIFFNIFAHLGFGLSATMRAEGSPKPAMYAMLTGCVANLVLDPFFIFKSIPLPFCAAALPGLGLGVYGAAWATNISMVATCLAALWFYVSGKSAVKLRLGRIRIYGDLAPRVVAIGLSPFFIQLLAAFIGFSINRAFAKWCATPDDGSMQISAFGIVNTVAFLFFIPTHGIQQGLTPIIGFNWGAEAYRRVRKCLENGLAVTAGSCIISTLLVEIFARSLARCFAGDEEVVARAARAIRIGNCMIWSIFVNVSATTYYQAVGKPSTAIILSLFRQCLCILPIVWFLPYFMEDKVLAVWLALPASDLLAQIATMPFLAKEFRLLTKKAAAREAAAP